MPLTVQEVPIEYVNVAWPSIELYIEAALPHSNGDLALDEIKSYCVIGAWKVFVAVDENNVVHGAATVHFFNRINHRVAFITTFGGTGIISRDLYTQFCIALKSHGATCIEGAVRDSLMRLSARFGAKKKANFIQFVI